MRTKHNDNYKKAKYDYNPFSRILTNRFKHTTALKYAELDSYISFINQLNVKSILDLSFGNGGCLEYSVYKNKQIKPYAIISLSHFQKYSFSTSAVSNELFKMPTMTVKNCFEAIEDQIKWIKSNVKLLDLG